jgi:signal recognition particle subunit SRP54
MFSSLSDNLSKIFDKLRGKGYLNDDDVNTAMREIRIALLEADVSLPVVKEFIEQVKIKAIGAEITKSISPGQQVVKIVNDELNSILASEDKDLNLNAKPPVIIMMVGLQGSGKTTTTAKLALNLRQKHKKKVLLASLDTYRPAAQEQLTALGKQVNIDCLEIVKDEKPLEISQRAINQAHRQNYDVLLLDTAGRLHTDAELIQELVAVKKLAQPIEILLVADALTGQDAVNIGKEFHEKVGVTGVILTRVDGDARGGAALSMRKVTGCPIKFLGVGEKISDLEEFHPERIASRILDMGDIVSLVEKAAEVVDKEEAERMSKKLQKGKFDMDDLLAQFKSLKKLGGIGKVASLIPGMGKIKTMMEQANVNDKMIAHQEAIIFSMTKKERKNPFIINASRKKRIAMGAGRNIQEVNRLLKQYLTMINMVKKFGSMSPEKAKQFEKMLNV